MQPTIHPAAPFVPETDFGCPQQAMGLLGDVEQHLARLRAAQSGQDRELEAVRARWQELAQREAMVAEGFARLEAGERWLRGAMEAIERRQADLMSREGVVGFDRLEVSRQAQALEEMTVRHARQEQAIAALSEALADARAKTDADRARLEGEVASLAGDRASLVRRLRETEARLDALRTGDEERSQISKGLSVRLEDAQQQLAEANARAERQQVEAARLREQHRGVESKVRDLEQRLAASDAAAALTRRSLEEKLAQTERLLEGQRAELVESRSGGVEAEALRHRLASLEQSLADARVEADAERVRTTDLRRQLESATAARREDEVRRNASTELQEELAGVRTRLDRSESEAASLRGELEQAKSRIERETRTIATLQRQLDQQAASSSEIESARRALAEANGRLEASSRRAVELEAEVESLRTRIEAERATTPASSAEVERLERELSSAKSMLVERDARVQALAAEVREARNARGTADAGEASRLQERARQLSRAAELLRVRRDRLHRLREALRRRVKGLARPTPEVEAPRTSGQSTLIELRQLQAKREELRQVQKFLAESEVRLVRRWAVHRGASLGMLAGVFAVVLAVAGWMAADLVWPVRGTASVDLIARGAKGQPIDPRLAEGWGTWHAALLGDPLFAEQVAERLAARGAAPSDPAKVGAMLSKDLKVDADGPGRLRLVLSGEDRNALPVVLDSVATSLAKESAAQASRRPDQTPAIVVGERTKEGKIAYSLLDPRPIDATQLTRAGLVAGGLLACSVVIGVAATLILRRVRRIMGTEEHPSLAA